MKEKTGAVMKTDRETEKAANFRDMVARVEGIKEGLTRNLANLREKIKMLETEKDRLLIEIEDVRKAAESRANELENEVNMLREVIRSYKDLLGNRE